MGLKLNMPFIAVVVLGMALLAQSVPIENQPDVPSDSEPAQDPSPPSGNPPTANGEKMWPFLPFPSSITTLFQGSAPAAPPAPPPPPPPPVIFINPPPPPPTTTTTTTSTTTTTTTPATTTTTSSTTTTPPPPPPPPRN